MLTEHAHVACEVAKYVARRAIDEFDDSKFDPFATSCPTKAVKRNSTVTVSTPGERGPVERGR